MTDEKRPYRMKVRAELQDETRRRITESAVELHGTLGPSRTSMSAVAARAGVPRSTLYRHFPDEAALMGACAAHWFSQHPPPDLERWADVADPDQRLELALSELYAYYDRAEPMIANVLRDLELVEAVQSEFERFRRYIEAAQATLMVGRQARGHAARVVRAAVGHAIAFTTWRSLVREQGLRSAEAVQVVGRLVPRTSRGRTSLPNGGE